jgi:mRNA interferase MazF
MGARCIPGAGDVVWLEFDLQQGREQAKRHPARVLTEKSYNRASGLAVVCSLTSQRKAYPFALPTMVDKVEGAIRADHLKSLDWAARPAKFHSKAYPALLKKVRAHIGVLLRMR